MPEKNFDLATWLRYRTGTSVIALLDFLLVRDLLPFASRLPRGFRFHYDLRRYLDRMPCLVVDAGANIGQTALAFARWWPAARIHSFEPIAATYARLATACGNNPRIECHRLALGDAESEAQVSVQDNSELNSLLAPSGTGATERVRVRRLDDWAAERRIERIDLLKIDVEGYELRVLAGAEALLREHRISAVFAECTFMRNGATHALFDDLDRHLNARDLWFSGWYDFYRWGPSRRFAGFANGLWLPRI